MWMMNNILQNNTTINLGHVSLYSVVCCCYNWYKCYTIELWIKGLHDKTEGSSILMYFTDMALPITHFLR